MCIGLLFFQYIVYLDIFINFFRDDKYIHDLIDDCNVVLF